MGGDKPRPYDDDRWDRVGDQPRPYDDDRWDRVGDKPRPYEAGVGDCRMCAGWCFVGRMLFCPGCVGAGFIPARIQDGRP